METLVTIACFVLLAGLGAIICKMYKTIQADRKRLDERERRELQQFDDDKR